VATAVDRIRQEYEKDGYLQVELNPELVPMEEDSSRVNLIVSVTEGSKVGIRSIRIVGNRALSDRQVRRAMETDTGFWILSRGDYDRQKLIEDRERIAQRYGEAGFMDARVVSDSIAYDRKRKNITLYVTVEEGEPYTLRSLTWEGVKLFDEEQVRGVIVARTGERYNETRVGESQAGLQALYLEEGYVYTDVTPNPSYEGHEIDIVLSVYEGEPANVAHIYISGNTKTKDHVIRREVLLKPGERFSRNRFERSLREVMALNFFANVELDPPPAPTDNGDLDVSIKVTASGTG
jgi:outer membrane protein insertion porin family